MTNNSEQSLNGWLFIDKPSGMSSFDVIRILRKSLGIKKIGHGGTLDPLASGVLPIALNEGTKIADYILNADKSYSFTIKIGADTDTLDSEGRIVATGDKFPSQEEIKNIIPKFMGKIEQIPPKYSAIKINGKRAYKLAREGKSFELKPREIIISKLALINYDSKEEKEISFYTEVSKGTYIRTLAQDIVKALGCYGHISVLRRESVSLNKKILLISSNMLYNMVSSVEDYIVSVEDMLDDISAYLLNKVEAKKLLQGNVESLNTNTNLKDGVIKALYNNKIIALLLYRDNQFKILRVFNINRNIE